MHFSPAPEEYVSGPGITDEPHRYRSPAHGVPLHSAVVEPLGNVVVRR